MTICNLFQKTQLLNIIIILPDITLHRPFLIKHLDILFDFKLNNAYMSAIKNKALKP